MNQQQTIFDENFNNQIRPRRRDLMPKWLTIYMWCIIVLSIGFFIWTTYFSPDYNANDPQLADPQTGESYRTGTVIGKYLLCTIFVLMGILVLLERRLAIRFNLVIAIIWTIWTMLMTLLSGLIGLTIGMLMPIFIPYWIGLFQIQRKWEKEAIAGNGLF
jgi:hypothetical protein